MSNKTAMMRLYDMLDKGQISEIAEIKEYFLMLEREQMQEMYLKGIENYDPTFKRKGGEQ